MIRRAWLSVLAVLLLFGTVARTAPTTYYVSTSGNDANSCATATSTTQANQKRTIAAGVACASAGDTVYIHAGTYTGSGAVIDSATFTVPSGTDFTTGAVTISGYPGETVTMQPPDGAHAIRLTTGSPHHLIIQDLIIDLINSTLPLSSPDGLYLSSGAHHNRFQRLEIKNNAFNGVHFSSSGGASGYNELLNSSIHDNGRTDLGNSGYGIYLSTSNNLIEGNDFYGNNGYGVHLNPVAGEGNNNIIRNNRIHANFVHGTVGGGGTTSYGVVVVNGDNNLVSNNLIYGNQGGILIYNNSTNTLVYNNTITGNLGHAGGGEAGINLQYFGSVIIRNNIIYNNANGSIVNDGGGGPVTESNNLTTDPSFVDAASYDFRLQSGSAAKDGGMTLAEVPSDFLGVSRPQGSAYDIGAYEGRLTTCAAANTAALTACIASAVLGDTITLTAGTFYDGPFDLPDKGAGSSYITITTTGFAVPAGTRVGPGNASTMAKIRTTGTGAALYTRFNAHHWQLIGVELTATFNDGLGTPQYGLFTMGFDGASGALAQTTSQLPTDIIIDRCYVHGTTTGQHVHGTMANAIRFTIKNSYYENIHAGGADSQDIIAFFTPGPGTIDNNYLAAPGQSVLLGGSGSFVQVGVTPSDISVTNNLMIKLMTWRPACVTGAELNCNGAVYDGSTWVIKNIFEIKNGRRITVDHNILKNNWTSGQFGEAFVLTPRNQVGSNTLSAAAGGASTITFPGSASSVTDAYLGASITINGGTGNVNYQTRDVTAYNGTTKVATVSPPWSVAPNATSTFVYGWPSWAMVQDCVFSNNVILAVDTVVNLQGWDNQRPSVENEHNTFTNNLAYSFNAGGRGIHTQRSAEFLTFTHNTWDLSASAGDILLIGNQTTNADGIFIPTPAGAPETVRGWVFNDNIITRSGTYEINGDSTSGNNALTISTFFISPSWQKNLFGGMVGSIPAGGSTAPSTATILANLRSPSTGDYRLTVGSAYLTASTTGGALGVNMCALPDPAGVGNTTFACSGDGGGFTPPPSPPAPPPPAGPVRLRFR